MQHSNSKAEKKKVKDPLGSSAELQKKKTPKQVGPLLTMLVILITIVSVMAVLIWNGDLAPKMIRSYKALQASQYLQTHIVSSDCMYRLYRGKDIILCRKIDTFSANNPNVAWDNRAGLWLVQDASENNSKLIVSAYGVKKEAFENYGFLIRPVDSKAVSISRYFEKGAPVASQVSGVPINEIKKKFGY